MGSYSNPPADAKKVWKWHVSWQRVTREERDGRFVSGLYPAYARLSEDGSYYDTWDENDGREGSQPLEPEGVWDGYEQWFGIADSYEEALRRIDEALPKLAGCMVEKFVNNIDSVIDLGAVDKWTADERAGARYAERLRFTRKNGWI